MRDCTWERNKADCNCTYEPCSRKGICCECLRYHWRLGELPACLFPDDVEKTYDRSVERFIETCQIEKAVVEQLPKTDGQIAKQSGILVPACQE